ncbi:hypothetical protein LCGC14_1169810 [marine sediment metagenome]|uniref:Uncharacterized protein n=1 Tax=marine sediment metagenome TaxID=412755 RepID=A0A0F9PVM8_9ZZZZ
MKVIFAGDALEKELATSYQVGVSVFIWPFKPAFRWLPKFWAEKEEITEGGSNIGDKYSFTMDLFFLEFEIYFEVHSWCRRDSERIKL